MAGSAVASPEIALPGLPALVRPGGPGRRLIGGGLGAKARIAGSCLHQALLECLESAGPAAILVLDHHAPGTAPRFPSRDVQRARGGERHDSDRQLSHRSPAGHSAASLTTSARSTFAAQNLNSGIFPNGSSAGLVSRLAAASTNANGMNTTPSGMPSS